MALRKLWTDQDLAKLASLVAKGETVFSIANKLGRTPDAVFGQG